MHLVSVILVLLLHLFAQNFTEGWPDIDTSVFNHSHQR